MPQSDCGLSFVSLLRCLKIIPPLCEDHRSLTNRKGEGKAKYYERAGKNTNLDHEQNPVQKPSKAKPSLPASEAGASRLSLSHVGYGPALQAF